MRARLAESAFCLELTLSCRLLCRFVTGNPYLYLPEAFEHLTSDAMYQDLGADFSMPAYAPLALSS